MPTVLGTPEGWSSAKLVTSPLPSWARQPVTRSGPAAGAALPAVVRNTATAAVRAPATPNRTLRTLESCCLIVDHVAMATPPRLVSPRYGWLVRARVWQAL